MKKLFTILSILLVATTAFATQIPPRELSELIADADHVIVGKVIDVDMIDENGNQVKDREGRTGPGSENEIRLHVKIENEGILKTNIKKPITKLIIPLWQRWHNTLGHEKDTSEGTTYIFLLKGNNYEQVYPGSFKRPLSDRTKIKNLLEQEIIQNNLNIPQAHGKAAAKQHSKSVPEGGTYTVERVIDGDTIVVTDGKESMEVDLIGIDAPETGEIKWVPQEWAKYTNGERDIDIINKMGEESTKRAKEWVKGQAVRLEYDVQKKDKYGRILAYVFIIDKLGQLAFIPEFTVGTSIKDGGIKTLAQTIGIIGEPESYDTLEDIFLNATLINEGYAQPMTIPPNVTAKQQQSSTRRVSPKGKYADLFKELFKEARENQRGLWRDNYESKQLQKAWSEIHSYSKRGLWKKVNEKVDMVKTDIIQKEEDYVSYGCQGGVTGGGGGIKVKRNGEIIRWVIDTVLWERKEASLVRNDIAVSTLLFARLEEINFTGIDYNEPGNMTCSVTLRQGSSEHSVTANSRSTPSEVKEFVFLWNKVVIGDGE